MTRDKKMRLKNIDNNFDALFFIVTSLSFVVRVPPGIDFSHRFWGLEQIFCIDDLYFFHFRSLIISKTKPSIPISLWVQGTFDPRSASRNYFGIKPQKPMIRFG